MRMINKLFPKAGLICKFLDHQLSEFIQIKRRAVSSMPIKQAVCTMGPQDASGSMESKWLLKTANTFGLATFTQAQVWLMMTLLAIYT